MSLIVTVARVRPTVMMAARIPVVNPAACPVLLVCAQLFFMAAICAVTSHRQVFTSENVMD